VNGTENNFFNYVGKELNESLNYNMLEMDWRHYDPAIGRFVGIDALAENYYSHTPYHYSKNNPIMYSDPTGLSPEALTTWVHNTETDETIWIDDGYNFTLDVNNDEFNEIKSSGAIESGTSAYNRWFWKAVWEDLTTSDGSISDDVTQFMITDEVEDGLEMIDGVSNGQYATAGLTLFLRKVQKAKKGYKLIKKLFKSGKKGKMPTPDLNPDQFSGTGRKRVHKKTGAIFEQSRTSHGNKGNVGKQWKAWPKNTTNFGSTSKKTGTRVTIDGDGNVIGN
jgi:RHS repeat-associated protein